MMATKHIHVHLHRDAGFVARIDGAATGRSFHKQGKTISELQTYLASKGVSEKEREEARKTFEIATASFGKARDIERERLPDGRWDNRVLGMRGEISWRPAVGADIDYYGSNGDKQYGRVKAITGNVVVIIDNNSGRTVRQTIVSVRDAALAPKGDAGQSQRFKAMNEWKAAVKRKYPDAKEDGEAWDFSKAAMKTPTGRRAGIFNYYQNVAEVY